MSYFFISACRATNTEEENLDATNALRASLVKSPAFMECTRDCLGYWHEEGHHNPTHEITICAVGISDGVAIPAALELARKYNQDGFLYVDNNLQCLFVPSNGGESVSLGKWTNVCRHEAYENGAFTYHNQGYYIAVPEALEPAC